MPISVRDYTWTETTSALMIKVPLRGINKNEPDIFTSSSYLKANYRPFIFEVFLYEKINVDESKCFVEEENLIFNLIKCEESEWGNLEKQLTKQEKHTAVLNAIEEVRQVTNKRLEEKQLKKSELDRFAVTRAMEIDNEQHKIMDERKIAEKQKLDKQLECWRQKQKSKVELSQLQSIKLKTSNDKNKSDKVIKSEYIEKKKKDLEKRQIPNIREHSQMEVSFTTRTFPTPSRESTAAEEQAWLKNITAARRATGFVSEDLRPEEQDPQWCKEKGDGFFRKGNFLGAISAYSHGISLSNKLPSLYANRAATHFALGNFNKCLNDCSDALELMLPACEGNRISRARCIARRAAALARLGMLHKGIDEMKAASKLMPEDKKLKKDIYDMERAWEQNPDSD